MAEPNTIIKSPWNGVTLWKTITGQETMFVIGVERPTKDLVAIKDIVSAQKSANKHTIEHTKSTLL